MDQEVRGGYEVLYMPSCVSGVVELSNPLIYVPSISYTYMGVSKHPVAVNKTPNSTAHIIGALTKRTPPPEIWV